MFVRNSNTDSLYVFPEEKEVFNHIVKESTKDLKNIREKIQSGEDIKDFSLRKHKASTLLECKKDLQMIAKSLSEVVKDHPELAKNENFITKMREICVTIKELSNKVKFKNKELANFQKDIENLHSLQSFAAQSISSRLSIQKMMGWKHEFTRKDALDHFAKDLNVKFFIVYPFKLNESYKGFFEICSASKDNIIHINVYKIDHKGKVLMLADKGFVETPYSNVKELEQKYLNEATEKFLKNYQNNEYADKCAYALVMDNNFPLIIHFSKNLDDLRLRVFEKSQTYPTVIKQLDKAAINKNKAISQKLAKEILLHMTHLSKEQKALVLEKFKNNILSYPLKFLTTLMTENEKRIPPFQDLVDLSKTQVYQSTIKLKQELNDLQPNNKVGHLMCLLNFANDVKQTLTEEQQSIWVKQIFNQINILDSNEKNWTELASPIFVKLAAAPQALLDALAKANLLKEDLNDPKNNEYKSHHLQTLLAYQADKEYLNKIISSDRFEKNAPIKEFVEGVIFGLRHNHVSESKVNEMLPNYKFILGPIDFNKFKRTYEFLLEKEKIKAEGRSALKAFLGSTQSNNAFSANFNELKDPISKVIFFRAILRNIPQAHIRFYEAIRNLSVEDQLLFQTCLERNGAYVEFLQDLETKFEWTKDKETYVQENFIYSRINLLTKMNVQDREEALKKLIKLDSEKKYTGFIRKCLSLHPQLFILEEMLGKARASESEEIKETKGQEFSTFNVGEEKMNEARKLYEAEGQSSDLKNETEIKTKKSQSPKELPKFSSIVEEMIKISTSLPKKTKVEGYSKNNLPNDLQKYLSEGIQGFLSNSSKKTPVNLRDLAVQFAELGARLNKTDPSLKNEILESLTVRIYEDDFILNEKIYGLESFIINKLEEDERDVLKGLIDLHGKLDEIDLRDRPDELDKIRFKDNVRDLVENGKINLSLDLDVIMDTLKELSKEKLIDLPLDEKWMIDRLIELKETL